MKESEQKALQMDCYIVEEENAILVYDLFKDEEALGYHLMGTAAKHFGSLLEIADPGSFFFCGDISDEMKQAIKDMKLHAEFGKHGFGFKRS